MDMGDFVGGMLKYIRKHPIPRVTIAGGFAKMVKLSQGLIDLHSRSGSVDLVHLARLAGEAGASDELVAAIPQMNSALEALQRADAEGVDIAGTVAAHAVKTAARLVRDNRYRRRCRDLRPRGKATRPHPRRQCCWRHRLKR